MNISKMLGIVQVLDAYQIIYKTKLLYRWAGCLEKVQSFFLFFYFFLNRLYNNNINYNENNNSKRVSGSFAHWRNKIYVWNKVKSSNGNLTEQTRWCNSSKLKVQTNMTMRSISFATRFLWQTPNNIQNPECL